MKLSSFLCSCFLFCIALPSLKAQDANSTAGASISTDASASTGTSSSTTTVATSPNYILSPNDLLEIKVFQEDDLHTIVRVPKDGNITFPLIGTVKVGGKSVAQATETIRSRLQEDYLVNPQVNLTITEYAKRHFTIIGQVQKPGAYDIPDEQQIDLLDAVAMAGGYTRIADPGSIRLKRSEGGKEVIYKLNAKTMANKTGVQIIKVQEGDTIFVPESIF